MRVRHRKAAWFGRAGFNMALVLPGGCNSAPAATGFRSYPGERVCLSARRDKNGTPSRAVPGPIDARRRLTRPGR